MTLKVITRLQAFSSAIRQTFVQYFTTFQLTARRAVPQRQLGFLFLHVVTTLYFLRVISRIWLRAQIFLFWMVFRMKSSDKTYKMETTGRDGH